MSPLAHAMRALVIGYRWTLSPFVGWHCRFQPTCSAYALEALERHGAIVGGWLTLRRLLRCHPWGGWGYDPVPPAGAGRDSGSASGQDGGHAPTCCAHDAAESSGPGLPAETPVLPLTAKTDKQGRA